MWSRWMGVVWVGSAAATLGIVVGALAGGDAPPWWLLVLLIALPTTITLVGRRITNGATGERVTIVLDEGHRRVAPAATRASWMKRANDEGGTDADWEVVGEISRALDSREVAWLRSNDFVTPWLDSHVRRAMDLEPLVARVVDGPFEPGLVSALRILSGAITAFGEFHADNTAPDPLLLGEDWRFFHWDDPGGAGGGNGDGPFWAEQAAHLHRLAEELADAYEFFSATAARNPRLPSLTEMRV